MLQGNWFFGGPLCCARACGSKELFLDEPLRHDSAALDSPSQAQGYFGLSAQVVP